jgi:hypothetical protein
MRTRIMLVLAAAAVGVVLLSTGALAGGTSGTSQAKSGKSHAALFAVMNGHKEVSATGRRGAGDLGGYGSFSATVDGNQLCFGITVAGIDAPIAAHIHKGRANRQGDVVVPLTAPTDGDPGASAGCVTVESALIAAILKNAHRYYVNVHTTPFPAGAVRGQLFRKNR